MAKQGQLPADEKLRQLRTLGARFYLCGGSMDHFKVTKSDLAFDDLPIVQYITFIEVMDEAQVHVFLQLRAAVASPGDRDRVAGR
jgi:predicted peroxiredoxin